MVTFNKSVGLMSLPLCLISDRHGRLIGCTSMGKVLKDTMKPLIVFIPLLPISRMNTIKNSEKITVK